jgi:hypothetical protein
MTKDFEFEWHEIPGMIGYGVTTCGRIGTRYRRVGLGRAHGQALVITDQWQEIVPGLDATGHLRARFGKNVRRVNEVMLKTFKRRRKKTDVPVHLNGNKLDCRIENLDYGPPNQQKPRCKLSLEQVFEVERRFKDGQPIKKIANAFKVSQSVIAEIVRGRHRILKTSAEDMILAMRRGKEPLTLDAKQVLSVEDIEVKITDLIAKGVEICHEIDALMKRRVEMFKQVV